ncbi:Collagen alpha-5(VI) chain [Frankliniella fusca]|uniref:Collagen alpha-5(VI) chain n=1 Tax=Frankliniella fusca TaxID=407009 RepID=A0AAE1HUR8_9NEOP|nr:Collagen alpha-5(VI) chain [Frankliniella fusca]
MARGLRARAGGPWSRSCRPGRRQAAGCTCPSRRSLAVTLSLAHTNTACGARRGGPRGPRARVWQGSKSHGQYGEGRRQRARQEGSSSPQGRAGSRGYNCPRPCAGRAARQGAAGRGRAPRSSSRPSEAEREAEA